MPPAKKRSVPDFDNNIINNNNRELEGFAKFPVVDDGDETTVSNGSWEDGGDNDDDDDDKGDELSSAGKRRLSKAASPNVELCSALSLRRSTVAIDDAIKVAALGAVASLSCFESMPLKAAHLVESMHDHQIWQISMDHFHSAISIAADFAKHLSEFIQVSVKDRTILLKNCFPALIAAQVTLPTNRGRYSYLGLSRNNQKVFSIHFPAYGAESVGQVARQLEVLMAEWNPNFLEFAILQATLFFKYSTTSQLSNPALVGETHRRLVQALLSSHPPGTDISKKMDYFARARKLLLEIARLHRELAGEFARQRPELFHSSNLYAEVYSGGQQQETALARTHYASS